MHLFAVQSYNFFLTYASLLQIKCKFRKDLHYFMQQSLALFGMNEEIKRKKNAKKIFFAPFRAAFIVELTMLTKKFLQKNAQKTHFCVRM